MDAGTVICLAAGTDCFITGEGLGGGGEGLATGTTGSGDGLGGLMGADVGANTCCGGSGLVMVGSKSNEENQAMLCK